MTAHPAPFSDPIVDVLERLVRAEARRVGFIELLDPFAGVGRIHRLHRPGYVETTGLELEPEWAEAHPQTRVGNVLAMPRRWGRRFDVVATSPCYGNRFSDHHDPKDPSIRRSYAFDLGRQPSDESAAVLPWGPRYWSFHARALAAIYRVLKPGGLLLWNVSDFERDKKIVHAVDWHLGAAYGAGFRMRTGERPRIVQTRRMRYGANHDKRAPGEVILRLRREET